MKKYILSIDQGTSSTRAMLFDHQARAVAKVQQTLTQHFPQPSWVEHDPEEIWQTVLATANGVMRQTDTQAGDIAAIGITNQRETSIIWHRKSGKVIYPAIVWQDRRTAEYCHQFYDKTEMIYQKTGLIVDPYFSASKIAWMLDHVPGARQAAEAGELAFGTVESFILWRLSNGQSHYTDMTNASRSLLFNIQTQQWDETLLKLFDIPASLLPTICQNCADFGISDKHFFGEEIPITGMSGDQQASAFGQTCFSSGLMKTTYGTGCFMLLNTGDQLLHSRHRLLSTIAYSVDGKVSYALEGSIFMAGAILQWLRDKLGIIDDTKKSSAIAASLQDSGGVFLVPAFAGMGAPYWQPRARAAIIGMTHLTDRRHIIRAGLEAVAYQTRDLMAAMEKDGNIVAKEMHADGGMANNDFLMQFVADLLNVEVVHSNCLETTALGVAYFAGLHSGFYQSMAQLKQLSQEGKRFLPKSSPQQRQVRYQQWQMAVQSVLSGGAGALF